MHVIFKEFKSSNDNNDNAHDTAKKEIQFYDKLIQLIIDQTIENKKNNNGTKINWFAYLKKEYTKNENINYSYNYPIYELLTHINNNYNNYLFFQTSYFIVYLYLLIAAFFSFHCSQIDSCSTFF